jgi:hypothetical protein
VKAEPSHHQTICFERALGECAIQHYVFPAALLLMLQMLSPTQLTDRRSATRAINERLRISCTTDGGRSSVGTLLPAATI